jgi:lysophospholipase L1-like esterase
MKPKKNYIRKSFFLTLITIFLLFLLFFLPRITIFDKTMRRVDIISDILEKDSAGNVLAEVMIDSLQGFVDSMAIAGPEPEVVKLDYKDSIPDGMIAIEDFADSTGVNREMDRFYKALDDSGSRLVRIAVFGDSYIEGDILTSALRHLLQSEYGGRGVGFVEVSCVSEGFRNTVRNNNSGWEKHHSTDKRGFNASSQSMASSYFIPGSNATFTLTCQDQNYGETLTYADVVSVWYNSTNPLNLSLSLNDGQPQSINTQNIGVQCFTIPGDSITKASLHASGSGIVYGMTLDGRTGICVDNYSLRGSPGLNLETIPADFLTAIAKYRPYDLIIYEFGLNVASEKRKDYSNYTERFSKVIQKMKSHLPDCSFLVFGASDRAKRGADGRYHTMKGVESLISYQRKMASDNGVAFWNLRDALGGDGAIAELQKQGMAAKDYTHLNFKGGEHIAKLFFEVLQNGKMNYDKRHGK